jgi:hypothetical protein
MKNHMVSKLKGDSFMSIEKIGDGNVNVCIIGLGYMGLPLPKAFLIENKSVKWVMSNYASRITHYRSRVVDTMSEIVNQSLQKIAKGTGIVFIGTIIGIRFIYKEL